MDSLHPFGATLGLVVDDLDSGRTFSHNGDLRMPLASVVKVPLMVAVLRQCDVGNLTLQDRLPIETVNQGYDGPLLQFPVGAMLTVRELLYWTICHSDNTATDTLWWHVGIGAINATMRELGLRNFDCRMPMRTSFLIEAGLGRGWGDLSPKDICCRWTGMSPTEQDQETQQVRIENRDLPGRGLREALRGRFGTMTDGWTQFDPAASVERALDNFGTPRDMAALLRMIALDQCASPEACGVMRKILLRQARRDRIPKGLPDAVVGNKTGTIAGVTNDVALVWSRGVACPPYVLVTLLDRLTLDASAKADQAIARLARATSRLVATW